MGMRPAFALVRVLVRVLVRGLAAVRVLVLEVVRLVLEVVCVLELVRDVRVLVSARGRVRRAQRARVVRDEHARLELVASPQIDPYHAAELHVRRREARAVLVEELHVSKCRRMFHRSTPDTLETPGPRTPSELESSSV